MCNIFFKRYCIVLHVVVNIVMYLYETRPKKPGLIYKSVLVHIMAPISCSVCAIKSLLLCLLNSLWISCIAS